ncbi:MAG: hypothetical protein J5725_03600 [Bacteroidales bacterium]|nr:hypothetical protein [Bacteroidales bacterium]
MAYFVTHDWMSKELHLKGLQKELYAIIYGFSQDGETEFYGSLNYLADLTGNTTRGIQKALTELVNANLLSATKVDGKPTRYKVNPRTEFQTHELSSPNNKDNTKTFISKDMNGKATYQSCMELTYEIVRSEKVREKLKEYLRFRLTKGMANLKVWKLIIDDLYNTAANEDMALSVIDQSLKCSYTTFYPLKKSYKQDTEISKYTATLEEDDITKAYHEWAEDGRFFGTKEEFRKLIETGGIII